MKEILQKREYDICKLWNNIKSLEYKNEEILKAL
jgi:hypothetical protein